jgi:aspartate racemase
MPSNSTQRCLGLIGGLGVGAAIHYYRELARAHEARGSSLRLVMVHADMRQGLEYIRAGELPKLAEYLADLIGRLRASGAEIAIIPAVTPHICVAELEAISPLPLVNILSATGEAIEARGFRRVSVFGTRFSIETDLFGQVRQAEIIRPQPAEIDFIHEIYFGLAETGIGSAAQREQLSALAHRLIDRERLDGIVLAGTDLSLIFDRETTDFPHIDCAREHIGAIMSRTFC